MLKAELESINDYYTIYDFALHYLARLDNAVMRLNKELGTNFFSICRLQNKNLFTTCLATNPNLGEFWFTTGRPFPVPPASGFYLAERLPAFYSKEFIQYISETYELENLLFYVEHRKKYVDIYGFASAPNRPNVFYKYLNGGTHTIMKFIPFFRESFKKIFEEGDQKPFIYHQDDAVYLNPYFPNEIQTEKSSSKYSSLQIKQFETDLKCLPDRMYDTVQLAAQGLTSKESAKELNISYRTVESYIAHAKCKLKVYDIHQLRDLFLITTS